MKRFSLLPRNKNSNKSDFGHVLIVAGSKSMSGAAILTTRAALASGSGLVTVATVKSVASLIAGAVPEALLIPPPVTYQKISDAVQKNKINVMAVGPGLSQKIETAILVRRIVRETALTVVLDADGLNSFKGRADLLKKKRSELILTPHHREFERLFGTKLPEHEPSRLRLAKKLSKFYDVVLVLKGHRTLVVDHSRHVVNKTGNPGMAKGGSGDVLTGMIAAFIAQGLRNFEAAAWAVHYHGKAGDLAVKDKGELGLTASDIINYLPKAFSS